MSAKHVVYHEKFVHLEIGLCQCQYLGTLDPSYGDQLTKLPWETFYTSKLINLCNQSGQVRSNFKTKLIQVNPNKSFCYMCYRSNF